MNKPLKIFLTTGLVTVISLLMTITIRVYHTPDINITTSDSLNVDLLKELSWLEAALAEDADLNMQAIYPEGYVFMNALYGLSWCNVLSKLQSNDSLRTKGLAEIQKAYEKINSETGRSNFDETLPLPYGAFYSGWSNYLLGRKLLVEDPSVRNSTEVTQFISRCDSIASTLKRQTYPESYYGQVWPADAMLCAASLALHDKLFEPKYAPAMAKWIDNVKSLVDKNGLIPHSIYRDLPADDARGSSQSLMLIFLNEIDPEFARSQYEIYEKLFIDTRFGLTGIREYPAGTFGLGDIDSGPIILQMGGAATIVGLQTTALFGNRETNRRINGTLEALGVPVGNQIHRWYLFGALPMADAFIAWSHSSQPPLLEPATFFRFHLYSLLFIGVCAALIWWLWKKSRPKSNLVVGW